MKRIKPNSYDSHSGASPPILTVTELASRLKVPKNTVYYWSHIGKIPSFKAGRHLRFDFIEVLQYLKAYSSGKSVKFSDDLKALEAGFSSLKIEDGDHVDQQKGD